MQIWPAGLQALEWITWPMRARARVTEREREKGSELYREMPFTRKYAREQGMYEIQIKLLDWKPFSSHRIANKHHILCIVNAI